MNKVPRGLKPEKNGVVMSNSSRGLPVTKVPVLAWSIAERSRSREKTAPSLV